MKTKSEVMEEIAAKYRYGYTSKMTFAELLGSHLHHSDYSKVIQLVEEAMENYKFHADNRTDDGIVIGSQYY